MLNDRDTYPVTQWTPPKFSLSPPAKRDLQISKMVWRTVTYAQISVCCCLRIIASALRKHWWFRNHAVPIFFFGSKGKEGCVYRTTKARMVAEGGNGVWTSHLNCDPFWSFNKPCMCVYCFVLLNLHWGIAGQGFYCLGFINKTNKQTLWTICVCVCAHLYIHVYVG